MATITKLRPDSRFFYQPGSNGVDSTFDIFFEDTDQVIASLPYWDAKAETEENTLLLMRAFDRLYERSGSLHMKGLASLNSALEKRLYGSDDDPSEGASS